MCLKIVCRVGVLYITTPADCWVTPLVVHSVPWCSSFLKLQVDFVEMVVWAMAQNQTNKKETNMLCH